MTLSAILDTQENHNNNVGKCLSAFAGQCSDALFYGSSLKIGLDKNIDSVFICAMGGSALAGDMIRDIAAVSGKIPFTVIRDYSLPPWAGKNSLVIALSYSGATSETLACCRQAYQRQATVITASSGGELKKLSQELGLFHLKLPQGFQPRLATLHMALPLLLLLNEEKLLEISDEDICATYMTLKNLGRQWNPQNPAAKNRAKATALCLYQRTTLIWGSQGVTATGARNFKNQLNETAETAAFCGTVPEVSHNEIMSLAHSQQISLVFLRSQLEKPEIAKNFDIAKELLGDTAIRLKEINLPGEDLMTVICASLFFGDLTAYYLSLLNKVDPENIALISSFKARMSR